MHTQHFDAIVIGAGLGGLLCAAQLLERGKRVAILERLPHCGGRFTARTFQGAQISTGAVHMLPFGSSGVLAHTLRRLRIPHRILDADVFGSFHVHGQQIRARGLLGVSRFLGPRQFCWFLRVGYCMFLRRLRPGEGALPFDTWLARHIDVERNPELVAFFASIARFALSLELHQVSTAEVISTTTHMLRFGAPGILQGGCAALTAELERQVRERGAHLHLHTDVLHILRTNGQATGVHARHKASGQELELVAPLVVSDIGPRATEALLHNRQVTQAEVLSRQDAQQEAIGLKVHILSDVSLIPHKGIMYCLDTRRIAGIVQPSNADPRLAPAGKHLLISHQVMQSANIAEEKALALQDLHTLFGEAFARHCRVLTMSAYRGEWPVNRRVQGHDVAPADSVQGLYLVGDAVKPSGYLMVEGVAQGVNQLLDQLDLLEGEGSTQRSARHVIAPPSRLHAIRWLWTAPGNS